VVDRSVACDLEAVSGCDRADVDREVIARHDLQRLRDSLAAMSPERAETLVLHDVLGHELTDIAGMMGVSVAAAQSRLVRGRRELAARMGGSNPIDEEGEE